MAGNVRSFEAKTKAQETSASDRVAARPTDCFEFFGAAKVPQRAGNLAAQRMFRAGENQAKLAVSQPNDQAEIEADRVADEVLSSSPLGIIQRKGAPSVAEVTVAPEYKEGIVHRKQKPGDTPQSGPTMQTQRAPLWGGGQTLPPDVRAFFEPRFNSDFGQVRVHADSQAAESAKVIQARAFTSGQDLVFDSGEFRPATDEGRKLLAHELTHVVQQQGAPALSPAEISNSQDTKERELGAGVDGSAGCQIQEKVNYGQFVSRAASASRQELEADAKCGAETVLTGHNYAPKYSAPAGTVLAYGEGGLEDWFPDPEQRSRTEQRALEQQGLTDPQSSAKLGFRTDSDALTRAASARYDISISASGGGGQIQSKTTVMLDYAPDRIVSVAGPALVQINPELGIGPQQNRPAFPYVLTFSRTINYSDRDGRTASAEIDGLVFLSDATIAAQVSGATPSYEALLALMGDSGYVTASVQGSGPITAYFAAYSATGNSLSIQSEGAASGLGTKGASSLLGVSRSADFVDPRMSAGEQYASLRALLLSAEAAELSRRTAEPGATSENSWFDNLTESLADLVGGALAKLIDALDSANKAIVARWDDLPPWARGILTAIGKFLATLAAMAAIAGLIVVAAEGAVTFGVAMLALGVIALAVGLVMSSISRLGEAWKSDNRWRLLLVPTVTVFDTLGISGIIEGISNQSVLTGATLNRTEEEQWETGTTGVLQLVGMFLMVRGMRAGPGGITVTPEVRGPMGDFHVLPVEKLPVLPEGHFWVRQGPEWILFRESAAPDVPLEISIYSDGQGNINYNIRSGSRVLQSEARTRPANNNYQGGENRLPVELRGIGADNPYLEQGTGTLFEKGHGIDYVHRIEGPGVRSSNADVANFTPQARYWNSFLRNHLVQEITGRGGGYREMPIYSKNPRLTANGTPIPSEFVFVETSPTGQPRAAWRIPNDPAITTRLMTQLPQYNMSLSDIPSVMIRPGGGLRAPGSIMGPFGWISGERGNQEDSEDDRHNEIELR